MVKGLAVGVQAWNHAKKDVKCVKVGWLKAGCQ